MAPIAIEEFKEVVLSRPVGQVVDDHVFGGDAWVFAERPELFSVLRRHLCDRLTLSEENIAIIGSGKTGFSLTPDNFGAPFSEESDVDVLVVDEATFDAVWMALLRWHYPRRVSGLGGVDADWARNRRKDLYWGWFTPERIRFEGLSVPQALQPLREISRLWFDAFRSLSRNDAFALRHYSGRLYRSWDHARLYHEDGLRQIANILRGVS